MACAEMHFSADWISIVLNDGEHFSKLATHTWADRELGRASAFGAVGDAVSQRDYFRARGSAGARSRMGKKEESDLRLRVAELKQRVSELEDVRASLERKLRAKGDEIDALGSINEALQADNRAAQERYAALEATLSEAQRAAALANEQSGAYRSPAPGDAPPEPETATPARAETSSEGTASTARDEETAPDDASGPSASRAAADAIAAAALEDAKAAAERERAVAKRACEQLAELRREVLHLRGRPESLGTPAGDQPRRVGDVEPDAREEADRLRRQLADAERRADASREEADELRRYVLGARTEIDDAADEAEARYAALREELERQSADVARLEDELEEAETRAVEAETRAVEAETRAVEAERVAALFRTPRDGTDVAPSFSHARVFATPSAAASGPSSFTVSSATHASMETLRRRAAAAEAEAAAWAARARRRRARRRGGDGDGVVVRDRRERGGERASAPSATPPTRSNSPGRWRRTTRERGRRGIARRRITTSLTGRSTRRRSRRRRRDWRDVFRRRRKRHLRNRRDRFRHPRMLPPLVARPSRGRCW